MQSAKYNILIETGTDFAMPFTVYDDNDMPMDLTDARIEAHLREFEASPDYFEFSCINNGAGGRITITLPHETTSQIPYSYGVYDVKIEFPNGSIAYPLYGDVKVRNGITKSNDGTILFLVGINSFDDLPEVGSVNRMYYDYTNRIIYRWNGQNYVSAFYGGIADIHLKEHVDEYTDCYTIVYDNGQEFDFYVTAKGVQSVEKISSEGNVFSGIVDTYRMTFNTGTYVDYQITNGRMDVEAGIDIEYEAPETLVINTTDNTGKYAPKDGNAYVQRNGEWNKINHNISSDSNGVKIKVDWDSDIDNIPQTFPPTAHTHDDRYYTESEMNTKLAVKQDTLTFDTAPTANSTNPVTSGGVKTALDTKQDALTFDNVPTSGSNNPVKSSGIKSALDEKANSTDVYTKTESDALLDAKENTIIKSASGAIASFDDGVEAPVAHVVAKIEPIQEGSGDPSPDNVRPITGWTGVNITVSSTLNAQDGTIYSITFPSSVGTVYGGSLDVSSGVLTVTHVLYTFDGSEDEQWTLGNRNIRYEFNNTLQTLIKTYESGGRGLSNIGIYDRGSSGVDSPYITSRSAVGKSETGSITHVLVVPPSIATTVSELRTFLSNNPEQWYAPLQTPLTYQLTPTEVTTLLGQNNIWADTGDVDVSYFTEAGEDVGKAFDNVSKSSKYDDDKTREMLTQSSESAMTASKNYTAGNLIIINDKLLRATANIASGGTITIGTNAEEVDLETVIAEKVSNNLISVSQNFKIVEFLSKYNSEETFTVGKSARIVVYILDSAIDNNGVYIIVSTASSVVSIIPILSATNLSLSSPSSGKLKITKSAVYQFRYIAIIANGEFTLDS